MSLRLFFLTSSESVPMQNTCSRVTDLGVKIGRSGEKRGSNGHMYEDCH